MNTAHRNDVTIKTPEIMNTQNHRSQKVDALLSAIELQITHLVSHAADERSLSALSLILHDLTSVRLELGRPGRAEKRTSQRFHECAIVAIEREDGQEMYATIQDISVGGALLEADDDLQENETCRIFGPGLTGKVPATVLSSRGGFVRVMFNDMSVAAILEFTKHVDRHFMRY